MQEQLNTLDDIHFFHELVNRLNSQIRGFQVCDYLFHGGYQ